MFFLENILIEAFEDALNLTDLRFAGDIALMADTKNNLQSLIERIHVVSKKYATEISIPKTKVIIFSYQNHTTPSQDQFGLHICRPSQPL